MFNTLNDNVDYKPNPNWCFIKSIPRKSRVSSNVNNCINYYFSRSIAFVFTTNYIDIRSHFNSVIKRFHFVNNQPAPGYLDAIKINQVMEDIQMKYPYV